MKRLRDRFFDRFMVIAGKICAYLLLAMIFLVFSNVIARLVFSKTIMWSDELARYLMIYLCFIGSARIMMMGEHLVIDILLVRYRETQKKIVRAIICFLQLAYCSAMMYFGIILCASPIVLRGRTSAMHIPKIALYVILPTSMFFCVLYLISHLVDCIADLTKTADGRDAKPEAR